MTSTTLSSLLVITLVACATPLLADAAARWLPLPVVLLELAAGVAVGPALLGWVREDDAIALLAALGLAMLMFFAGYELDPQRLRGGTALLAVRTWMVSLAAGLAVGLGLHLSGFHDSGLIMGLALTTTALGTLVPILKDAGAADTLLGRHALATGAIGEFGPILAISLLLSSRAPLRTAVLLLVFVVIAVAACGLALRPRPRRLARVVSGTLGTSGQWAVRLSLLVVVALVWEAAEFGLDVLLGAFTAGFVMRIFLAGGEPAEVEMVTAKLEAIGFGFLVPLFFVVSGVRFDLDALLASGTALLLLPAFLLLFLAVRGLPTLLMYRSVLGRDDRRALALLASTALPIVVAITTIGVSSGRLENDVAAALVGAGMLSVLCLPLLALRLRAPVG